MQEKSRTVWMLNIFGIVDQGFEDIAGLVWSGWNRRTFWWLSMQMSSECTLCWIWSAQTSTYFHLQIVFERDCSFYWWQAMLSVPSPAESSPSCSHHITPTSYSCISHSLKLGGSGFSSLREQQQKTLSRAVHFLTYSVHVHLGRAGVPSCFC